MSHSVCWSCHSQTLFGGTSKKSTLYDAYLIDDIFFDNKITDKEFTGDGLKIEAVIKVDAEMVGHYIRWGPHFPKYGL